MFPISRTTSKPALSGSCACQAVTYTSTLPPSHLDFCYCNVCAQISGAPFVGWLGIFKSALTWSGPVATIEMLANFATRSFCSKCGGTLTIQYDCYPLKTHVAAGTVLNSEADLPKVGCHIWTSSKRDWYTIPDDGVPRFEEFDDEFMAVWSQWQERRTSI